MRIFFTCLIPLLSTFTTAQASTYEGVVQLINIREGDGLVWINIDAIVQVIYLSVVKIMGTW
ncbi:hypothetical protein R4849_11410 [Acinetobacter baumannii]|nr:hypothetical protein [Acinetobacter baumannii]